MTRRTICGLAAGGLLLLAGLLLALGGSAPATSAQAGPDVVVESVALEPPIPGVGQVFTLTIVTRNQGDAATGNFWNYVYADPADRPPEADTAHTFRYNNLPLGPGDHSAYTRAGDPDLAFHTAGCDHVLYVWADKEGLVPETDEGNNLLELPVCVGVSCEADAYEEDDTCEAARWLTDTLGTVQHRTQCVDDDEDWVRFTAIEGLTYTLEALNLGPHADPLLSLYDSCGGAPRFGTGPAIEWRAEASGLYFLRIAPRPGSGGPMATYDLRVDAYDGNEDPFEPDDSCPLARDIATDGLPQTHRFQSQGDEDWIKFAVGSGQRVTVQTGDTAAGVAPLLSLYRSCEQEAAEPADQAGPLQAGTPVSATFYVRLANQDPGVYGPGAHYDVRVTAADCQGDAFEPDDGPATAGELQAGAPAQRHDTCPAGDVDWTWFEAAAGEVYVIQTSGLGPAADTELALYDGDGATLLAHNDDAGPGGASLIAWRAEHSGVYYVAASGHDGQVSGADTGYDLQVALGYCLPDAYEPDNGPAAAAALGTDGQAQAHTLCADPAQADLGDEDWLSFEGEAGTPVRIWTLDLGEDCDTVLSLYAGGGTTLLATNDDAGPGSASSIELTLPDSGTYYVQATGYNPAPGGSQTGYRIAAEANPEPTPTPSPTPSPTPPPTPTPSPPGNFKTLIVTNQQRLASLHGSGPAGDLMARLYALADHPEVRGAVLRVEEDAAVAAAYAAWDADLLSTPKANEVAVAIRGLVLSTLASSNSAQYIVIAGDDRVIPFYRAPEGPVQTPASAYASQVTAGTTQWAALQDNMTLTDDFYGDAVPTTWAGDRTLYISDYGIGRLVETPAEMVGSIDAFLADPHLDLENALVTGYADTQDTAELIADLLEQQDDIPADTTLVGPGWTGDDLQGMVFSQKPRFDFQILTGHATHTSFLAPAGGSLQAGDIVSGTGDLAGVLVYTPGCQAGLNDSGSLDLVQAFAGQRVNYVANTGFGWGGPGIVYSERLVKQYTRKLLSGPSARIGRALKQAKGHYYNPSQWGLLTLEDAAAIMEFTLYGLPMAESSSGSGLGSEDPFPSAEIGVEPPAGRGAPAVGHLSYGLAGSFGQDATEQGTMLDLDGWVLGAEGQALQPYLFADVTAPAAGPIHGLVLVSAVYSDSPGFDPVVTQACNEYVDCSVEPGIEGSGWQPAVPFFAAAQQGISTTTDVALAVLGQYDADSGTERLYQEMRFDSYYSTSGDRQPPALSGVQAVLDAAGTQARLKVEARDASGILRVLVTATQGQGRWQSWDLAYDPAADKWTGAMPATAETRYFVQVVDGAGNVARFHGKGRYLAPAPAVPMAGGPGYRLYLPLALKGGKPMQSTDGH